MRVSRRKNRRALRFEPVEPRLMLASGYLPHTMLELDDASFEADFSGVLISPADCDSIEMTVSSTGRLTITGQAMGGDLDSFLRFVDADGNRIAESDDVSPDDTDSRIQQHVLPGNYRIDLSHSPATSTFNGVGPTDGRYNLAFEWQPAAPPFKPISMNERPKSIATADFNRDGILDLVSGNAGSQDITILLGLGDGTFWPHASYPSAKFPSALTTAYLNDDEYLDIAVTDESSDIVVVAYGRGDGTFDEGEEFTVGIHPGDIAAGDLDGNGLADLIVANRFDKSVSVLLSRAGDTFDPQRTYSVGRSPRSVAVEDLDGDGLLDVLAANRTDDTVSVFRGKGDGTLLPWGSPLLVDNDLKKKSGPHQLAISDINNDGLWDFATTNDKSDSVTVFIQQDNHTFTRAATYPVGDDAEFILSADFNGDGFSDLATGNEDSHDVSILMNVGDGTFADEHRVPTYRIPDELAAGDFDGDGNIDLAVACRENSVVILRGFGDGTFRGDDRLNVGTDPEDIVATDFDGDGLTDLATANRISNEVAVLIGCGDGRFEPRIRLNTGDAPRSLVAADFNRDGRMDLAVANEQSDDISLLLGLGNGKFAPETRYDVGDSPWEITIDDFDGDGYLDLATANRISNDISVLRGFGNGKFDTQTRLPVGAFPEELLAYDFNKDGFVDLGTVNRLANDMGRASVLLSKGDGRFHEATHAVDFPPHAPLSAADVAANWNSAERRTRTDQFFWPKSTTQGDFNRDGHVDLAVANDSSHEIAIFLGDGDGTFAAELRFSTEEDPEWIDTADLNGDGYLDLVTANDHPGTVAVLLGLGTGAFAAPAVYEVGNSPEAICIGDFDGDNFPDLAVAHESDETVWIMRGRGDGTFETLNPKNDDDKYALGRGPQGFTTADLDGDGFLDLAMSNKESGELAVLWGRGDGSFQPATFLHTGSAPVSVAAADLDGDGQLDLVSGDLGQHTIWVLWGEGDGRSFSSPQRIGHTLEATGQAGDHATAPIVIADFNEDGRLDLARTNELRGDLFVFLARGDRQFHNEEAYQVGAAPGTLVVADVDDDGHLDLIAGNRQSHDLSVLRGRGDGSFESDSRIAGGQEEQPSVMADFNQDHYLDRATADANTGAVTVEVQLDHNGRFVAGDSISFEIDSTPHCADLNGDSWADVITLNRFGDILVRLAKPDSIGQFSPPIVVAPDHPARDVAVVRAYNETFLAAVAQDGKLISVYTLEDDAFQPYDTINVSGHVTRIAAGDVNGDKHDDLVVVDGAAQAASILLSQADNSWTRSKSTLPLGSVPREIALIDIGGPDGHTDDLPDLVVTNQGSGDVSILVNAVSGVPGEFGDAVRLRSDNGLYGLTVSSISQKPSRASDANPQGITSGDFDSDGHLDLAITNTGRNTFSILFGKAGGGFIDPMSYTTGNRPTEIRAAHVDDDGNLDLAVLCQADTEVSFFLGDGAGHFTKQVQPVGVGHESNGLAVEDVDADEIPDLLIGNRDGDLMILSGRTEGKFAPVGQSDSSPLLAAADFNEDGLQDTAVIYPQTSELIVYLGRKKDGKQAFQAKDFRFNADDGINSPRAIDVVDLDRDGRLDLLVTNSGANNVLLFLGNEKGFTAPKAFPVGMNPVGITVTQLDDDNGDGVANEDDLPDLVVANEMSNYVSIWLGSSEANEILRPGPQPQLKAETSEGDVFGRGPVAIETINHNDDPFVDLIVSSRETNSTFLFPGRGSGFFAEPTVFESAGQVIVGQYDPTPGLDLLILDPLNSSLRLYSGAHPQSGMSIDVPSLGTLTALPGDMNGDGFGDLAIGHLGQNAVSLLWGSANGLGWADTTTQQLDMPLLAVDLLAPDSLYFVAISRMDEAPISFALEPLDSEASGEPPWIPTSIASLTLASVRGTHDTDAAHIAPAEETEDSPPESPSAAAHDQALTEMDIEHLPSDEEEPRPDPDPPESDDEPSKIGQEVEEPPPGGADELFPEHVVVASNSPPVHGTPSAETPEEGAKPSASSVATKNAKHDENATNEVATSDDVSDSDTGDGEQVPGPETRNIGVAVWRNVSQRNLIPSVLSVTTLAAGTIGGYWLRRKYGIENRQSTEIPLPHMARQETRGKAAHNEDKMSRDARTALRD